MIRKYLAVCLIALLICGQMATALAAAPDMTVLDKTINVEKYLYGNEQGGALLERVVKLEKEIWGKEGKDALMTRVDKLYSYCNENFLDETSLQLKLNAVEWAMTHTVTTMPAKTRIENLEKTLTGNIQNTSVDDRMNKLLHLAYANGQVTASTVSLAKDHLIKIKLVTPLSSKTSRIGDIVVFEAAEDLYQDGVLVIAKGLLGHGKVTKVEEARNFGRDAELVVSFDEMTLIDGTIVSTMLGDKAKQENVSLAKAAGASVAGMAILGPIGVVGGAFVHGKDVQIPSGTQMYIQTKNEISAFGAQTH